MNKDLFLSNLRTIRDYPQPGILFFDVTTLFKSPECLKDMSDSIVELYRDKGITKVVGLESRGFILGAIVAEKLGAGFVPARKPGKLPAEVVSASYMKEYGPDTIEIHKDSIGPDDVVLIHDDILATGGTAAAAVELVKKLSPKAVYVNFILEIGDLPGSTRIPSDIDVKSLMTLKEKDF